MSFSELMKRVLFLRCGTITVKKEFLMKELRQNCMVFLLFLGVFSVAVVWLWFAERAFNIRTSARSDGPDATVSLLLSVVLLHLCAVLGSTFLAEETEKGTTPFLLRLPHGKMDILIGKCVAHFVLMCAFVIAGLIIARMFGKGYDLLWRWDYICDKRYPDVFKIYAKLCFFLAPLFYFSAVLVSFYVDRASTAFFGAIAYAIGGVLLMQFFTIRLFRHILPVGDYRIEDYSLASAFIILLVLTMGAVFVSLWRLEER